MIIDLHAHALSERFIRDIAAHPIAGLKSERSAAGAYAIRRAGDDRKSTLDPHLYDLPHRIESLRRRGVERQLFGPPPFLISWPGGAAGSELVRALHRMERDIADEAEGLMEPMAVLALGEPAKADDELRRAVEDYGFRAAIVPSSAGGRPLDDPVFDPLLTLIERLGLLIFMHPTSAVTSERFGMYGVHVLVGWPFETTLAVTRLIFNGVLERHPDLKILLAHGGGNLVFLRGRLDSAYDATGWEADPYFRQHIVARPSAYLDRLYYDTCALSEESNRFVIETMGADKVVFGSDYPFDIGDPEGRRAVPVIEALPPDAREKIYRGNALRLLEGVRATA
ncbi:MAG TPA: amidohydrolase family protein [Alphaproteobacteria bacterium]|nr:amidohydrolase family protein [Alphaproteobacteria bacterium]